MKLYLIATAFAALFAAPALSNGVQCPGNPGQWRDDPSHCPAPVQPVQPVQPVGDRLSQALTNAINIDNRATARAAATAIASTCAGSREGGCMSASVQVLGFGVAVQSGKGFVGDHIVEAEERCKAGNPALAVYLHRFDRKAATAMQAAGCTVQK